jgi:hypothetical protein
MKKIYTLFLITFLYTVSVFSQAPAYLSYQAVIRKADNKLDTSAAVGLQISILQGTDTGSPVYVETQKTTTNTNGLVSLEVGNGTVVSGKLSLINWSSGPYYIECQIDPNGGDDYTITGTTQLLSVPYALYANNSGSSNGWALNGNIGTSDTVNFIGTIDNKPFNIKMHNEPSGRIDSASGNTFFGFESGHFPINTGIQNTVVGMQSLLSNTTGVDNTAMGYHSLVDNTTGGNNVGYGFCTLVKNTIGSSNTALGNWTLFLNTASYNTAVGDSALYANTSGTGNAAVGYQALAANTTGIQNTVVGMQSLLSNTTGVDNTAMGYHSLVDNTTGGNNVGYGFCTLVKNTIGSSNTALGNWTLFLNTASYNTAVGDSALYANTSGTGNAAVGYQALAANTTGMNNTALGYGALQSNTNGMNNTALGYMADVGSANCNSIAIGYQATANENNVIVLGNSSVQKLYCAQTSITAISDGRFKKNIKSDIHGLDFILKLKPVSYNLDVTGLNAYQGKPIQENDKTSVLQAEQIVHNGFLAQDVEEAAKEVHYNFSGLKIPEHSGDIYGLGYTDFVVPLVKAVQELNETNENLKAENELLKAQVSNLEKNLTSIQSAVANYEKEIALVKNMMYNKTDKEVAMKR